MVNGHRRNTRELNIHMRSLAEKEEKRADADMLADKTIAFILQLCEQEAGAKNN